MSDSGSEWEDGDHVKPHSPALEGPPPLMSDDRRPKITPSEPSVAFRAPASASLPSELLVRPSRRSSVLTPAALLKSASKSLLTPVAVPAPRASLGSTAGEVRAPKKQKGPWACPMCTFENHAALKACEMCETPRPAPVATASPTPAAPTTPAAAQDSSTHTNGGDSVGKRRGSLAAALAAAGITPASASLSAHSAAAASEAAVLPPIPPRAVDLTRAPHRAALATAGALRKREAMWPADPGLAVARVCEAVGTPAAAQTASHAAAAASDNGAAEADTGEGVRGMVVQTDAVAEAERCGASDGFSIGEIIARMLDGVAPAPVRTSNTMMSPSSSEVNAEAADVEDENKSGPRVYCLRSLSGPVLALHPSSAAASRCPLKSWSPVGPFTTRPLPPYPQPHAALGTGLGFGTEQAKSEQNGYLSAGMPGAAKDGSLFVLGPGSLIPSSEATPQPSPSPVGHASANVPAVEIHLVFPASHRSQLLTFDQWQSRGRLVRVNEQPVRIEHVAPPTFSASAGSSGPMAAASGAAGSSGGAGGHNRALLAASRSRDGTSNPGVSSPGLGLSGVGLGRGRGPPSPRLDRRAQAAYDDDDAFEEFTSFTKRPRVAAVGTACAGAGWGDGDEGKTVGLFGLWQTEPDPNAPSESPLVDDVETSVDPLLSSNDHSGKTVRGRKSQISRNSWGNVVVRPPLPSAPIAAAAAAVSSDSASAEAVAAAVVGRSGPWRAPDGCVHINHKNAEIVAEQLGIDYARAVAGFSRPRAGGGPKPRFSGVVVAEDDAELLEEALADADAVAEEAAQARAAITAVQKAEHAAAEAAALQKLHEDNAHLSAMEERAEINRAAAAAAAVAGLETVDTGSDMEEADNGDDEDEEEPYTPWGQ